MRKHVQNQPWVLSCHCYCRYYCFYLLTVSFLLYIIICIIIIIHIPNIFSLLRPLVQSRTRTLRQTAPSQAEVTDLNCSDHSTTSKEMARGELWWVSIWHALKIRLYDTLCTSGCKSEKMFGIISPPRDLLSSIIIIIIIAWETSLWSINDRKVTDTRDSLLFATFQLLCRSLHQA